MIHKTTGTYYWYAIQNPESVHDFKIEDVINYSENQFQISVSIIMKQILNFWNSEHNFQRS